MIRYIIIIFFSSSCFSQGISNYSKLRLQFTAGLSTMIDTTGTNYIKSITDCSPYRKEFTQTNHSIRPIDNSSYWTFTNDELHIPSVYDLNAYHEISLYSRFKTTASANFTSLGLENYNGSNSGIGLSVNVNKAYLTLYLSKSFINKSGTSTINDGNEHKVYSTVQCSKKWSNYSKIIAGGEEPSVVKVGNIYYLFRDSLDNVYVDSSTSPYFTNGVKARLLVSNRRYPGAFYKSSTSTFYFTACNMALDSIFLYSSSSPTSGYSKIATVAVKGGLSFIADPDIIFVQDSFKCYYSAFTAAGAGTVYLATSKTGADGTWSTKGTVIPKGGSATDYDYSLTADPNPVILNDGSMILFYTGFNSGYSKQQTAYATSSDGGITFTKYSGNPIFYWSGLPHESGSYGPNEISWLLETGAGPGGIDIWRMYYRCKNTTLPFNIGMAEFFSDPSTSNKLPICGNETVVAKIYVDGSLEATETVSGMLGIDYMPLPSKAMYLGGNGTTFVRFTGDLYDAKFFNKIKTNF